MTPKRSKKPSLDAANESLRMARLRLLQLPSQPLFEQAALVLEALSRAFNEVETREHVASVARTPGHPAEDEGVAEQAEHAASEARNAVEGLSNKAKRFIEQVNRRNGTSTMFWPSTPRLRSLRVLKHNLTATCADPEKPQQWRTPVPSDRDVARAFFDTIDGTDEGAALADLGVVLRSDTRDHLIAIASAARSSSTVTAYIDRVMSKGLQKLGASAKDVGNAMSTIEPDPRSTRSDRRARKS